MPRPIFIRRASSALEIGSCSRTRLSRIWRLISRGVHRVARTKLRVLIFLIRGARAILRSQEGARTINRGFCSLPEHSRARSLGTRVRFGPEDVVWAFGSPAIVQLKSKTACRLGSLARSPTSSHTPAMTVGHSNVPAPTFSLHPDRFFDSEPAVRRAARELYEEMQGLPLVCPHGHVDPSLLSEDRAFPEPAALLITPDHYLFRMLYSRGVSMESLGVPTRDPKAAIERDPRKVWRLFAANYHLFRGTPSREWLDYELYELFGVRERLCAESADRIYDQIAERLSSPEFRPRALFESFNIEVLATTDAATDELRHHQAILASGRSGRVVPTFRPDALFRLANPAWSG